MKLKIKKLHPSAILPQLAHDSDAAYDLFSVESAKIFPGEQRLLDTGVGLASVEKLRIGEHDVAISYLIKDRSSVASKLSLVSHAGVIDSSYTGSIKLLLQNIGKEPVLVNAGQKIAQLLPVLTLTGTVEESFEQPETARGNGGFGSTD